MTIAALEFLQNKMLYYPEGKFLETPRDYGWPYEDVWLQTSDQVKLHAWWIGDPSIKETILFFHGNAGNISHRLDRISTLALTDFRFFLLSYRGYGQSGGKPSESGLFKDADAAYDFLRSQAIPPEKIILFGESLGGAVAVDLAARRPVGRVILESTFTSLRDMAAIVMPMLPNVMVSNSFNSIDKISKITAPKLFVHGTNDTIVPYAMGHQLFEAGRAPKELYEVKGADHNDLYLVGGSAYRERIQNFLHHPAPDT